MRNAAGLRARPLGTLLITAKDAVRWPRDAAAGVQVLEVEWEWIQGQTEIDQLIEG